MLTFVTVLLELVAVAVTEMVIGVMKLLPLVGMRPTAGGASWVTVMELEADCPRAPLLS
jgi:hypothetical protein